MGVESGEQLVCFASTSGIPCAECDGGDVTEASKVSTGSSQLLVDNSETKEGASRALGDTGEATLGGASSLLGDTG